MYIERFARLCQIKKLIIIWLFVKKICSDSFHRLTYLTVLYYRFVSIYKPTFLLTRNRILNIFPMETQFRRNIGDLTNWSCLEAIQFEMFTALRDVL